MSECRTILSAADDAILGDGSDRHVPLLAQRVLEQARALEQSQHRDLEFRHVDLLERLGKNVKYKQRMNIASTCKYLLDESRAVQLFSIIEDARARPSSQAHMRQTNFPKQLNGPCFKS